MTEINKTMTVILAEDDEGHAMLIQKNLRRVGITNPIHHFKDGQEVLDFLFQRGAKPYRLSDASYLLLLDVRMPKIDGIEVLHQVKQDKELRKMPVIMITTTDDPREVEICHQIGCSCYIKKPVDPDQFIRAIRQLGLFMMVVQVPNINTKKSAKA